MALNQTQQIPLPQEDFRWPNLFQPIPEDKVARIGLVVSACGFASLCISLGFQNVSSYHGHAIEHIVNTSSILITLFGIFLYFIDVAFKFQVFLAKKEIRSIIGQNEGKVCLNLLPVSELRSIDAFCQLLHEQSYFIDHPIVRQKGTLRFSSLMQDLDMYTKGTIPIRDLDYLKEILLELTNHFTGPMEIECVNTIPENSWPKPESGEKWSRFIEYADFMEESLKAHERINITQTFVFAHPDDFTQRLQVLKSLANHWWRTAIVSSGGAISRGAIKIAYHEQADIRSTEP